MFENPICPKCGKFMAYYIRYDPPANCGSGYICRCGFDSGQEYHLNCPYCGYQWWSFDAFPINCPMCGANRMGEFNNDTTI